MRSTLTFRTPWILKVLPYSAIHLSWVLLISCCKKSPQNQWALGGPGIERSEVNRWRRRLVILRVTSIISTEMRIWELSMVLRAVISTGTRCTLLHGILYVICTLHFAPTGLGRSPIGNHWALGNVHLIRKKGESSWFEMLKLRRMTLGRNSTEKLREMSSWTQNVRDTK